MCLSREIKGILPISRRSYKRGIRTTTRLHTSINPKKKNHSGRATTELSAFLGNRSQHLVRRDQSSLIGFTHPRLNKKTNPVPKISGSVGVLEKSLCTRSKPSKMHWVTHVFFSRRPDSGVGDVKSTSYPTHSLFFPLTSFCAVPKI